MRKTTEKYVGNQQETQYIFPFKKEKIYDIILRINIMKKYE